MKKLLLNFKMLLREGSRAMCEWSFRSQIFSIFVLNWFMAMIMIVFGSFCLIDQLTGEIATCIDNPTNQSKFKVLTVDILTRCAKFVSKSDWSRTYAQHPDLDHYRYMPYIMMIQGFVCLMPNYFWKTDEEKLGHYVARAFNGLPTNSEEAILFDLNLGNLIKGMIGVGKRVGPNKLPYACYWHKMSRLAFCLIHWACMLIVFGLEFVYFGFEYFAGPLFARIPENNILSMLQIPADARCAFKIPEGSRDAGMLCTFPTNLMMAEAYVLFWTGLIVMLVLIIHLHVYYFVYARNVRSRYGLFILRSQMCSPQISRSLLDRIFASVTSVELLLIEMVRSSMNPINYEKFVRKYLEHAEDPSLVAGIKEMDY